MENKKREDLEITEIGEIFFLYRPKVDLESPHSVDEVQRLYMVMRPVSTDNTVKNVELKQDSHSAKIKEHADEPKEEVDGEKEAAEIKNTVKIEEEERETKNVGGRKQDSVKEMDAKSGAEIREDVKHEPAREQGLEEVDLKKQALMRLIIVGKKVLPDPTVKTRPVWCFVDLVTNSIQAIKDGLSPVEYDTKTRGHRVQPGARPAGAGVYCLVRHKSRQKHTHLVYKLDKPFEEGDPQDAFRIEKEVSYIISVKNPETSAPPNAGLGNKRKATFPARLQALMGSYRFVPAHPPDYFNYEGCEFILAPASDDVEKELGMEIEPHVFDAKLCADLASIVNFEDEVARMPLFEGEWA